MPGPIVRLRDRVLDVSDRVEWLDDPQPFYEVETTVDFYDSVARDSAGSSRLARLKSGTSGALIDYIVRNDLRSVLDIGCGAGAFHHMLRELAPRVAYHGIDASGSQIARAKRNFGDDLFDIGDASALTVGYFASYEAIHMHSVLAFMSEEKQLALLDNILASGSKLLTTIGATESSSRFMPKHIFSNFRGLRVDDGPLLTAVNWLVRDRIDGVFSTSATHEVEWRRISHSAPAFINGSGRDGGAVLVGEPPSRWLIRAAAGGRKQLRLWEGTVKPIGWHIPSDSGD